MNNYSLGKFIIYNDKIYIINCLTDCQPDFNVPRRNIDGTLDTTFNQTGFFNYNFPGPFVSAPTYDNPTVLFKHSDSRIFIAGYTSSPSSPAEQYNGFAMVRIRDETLSNTEIDNNHFTLSPNPVHDFLNIENPNNTSIDRIMIVDILGKIVFNTNNTVNSINLENLKAGLYFVKIYNANTTECFKIIKEN